MKKAILVFSMLITISATAAVIPANGRPHSLSYAEWSALWWQWAFSLPAEGHPLFDETGADAGAGQSGQVWFLGGVFNLTGQAERNIEIPAGTALLIPIINAECSTVEAEPWFGSNETELRECVEDHISDYSNLSLVIDGKSVRNLEIYNVVSPMVTVDLPEGNILGVPAGETQIVSGGIYVMVAPLSAGKHTVTFTGTSEVDNFSVDLTYNIEVVPGK